MKLWKLWFTDEKYDDLMLDGKITYDFLNQFDGRSLINDWEIPKVCRMEPDNKNRMMGDGMEFYIPAFNEKALKVLYPLIANSVEVLDLDCKDGKYYGINVTAVLDIIDYERADYKTFRDGKRIMYFKKYAFRDTNELHQHNIFKLIDEPKRASFVTEKFKNSVEENYLTGFVFELVWDSEA